MENKRQPKVSVIVPIYNVEKYIERCVRSLMEQTLDDIEYIFVNDATPDGSMEVLNRVINEYPERLPMIKIINNDKNKGSAATRKTGMKAAMGKYQIHCDSDDWVEHDMYELMYKKATENDYDIVSSGFVCEGKNEYNEIHPILATDPHLYINSQRFSGGLTIRLIRSSVILDNNLYPLTNINYGEDRLIVLRSYFFSTKVSYIDKFLYHYNMDNDSSITKRSHTIEMIKQQIFVIDYMSKFFNKHGFKYKYDVKEKIEARSLCLILCPPNMRLFRNTFPEITKNVVHNASLSIFYRICYYIANKGVYFPMKLYIKLSILRRQNEKVK